VNRIGEVDGRRTSRQGDQQALRRETEHLILEELQLGVLQELLGTRPFRQRLDRLAKPGISRRVVGELRQMAALADLVFVKRVSGDAVLVDLLHVVRSELQLDALPMRTDDGSMQRLVAVRLRR
jgi:hypothetical protein